MKVPIFKTTIALLFWALFLYCCNTIFINNGGFATNFKTYHYSLEFMYLILTLFSISILIVLHFIERKNKDIVGMTFMLLTTFKIIMCCIIFATIISATYQNQTERINFFVVFILFLTMETLITIRLLNKKQ